MIKIKDFYADWCGPCKMVTPHIEKLEKNFPDISVEKINVDENSDLAAIYGVRNIPLVGIEKDDEIIERIVGVKPYEFYSDLIEKYNE